MKFCAKVFESQMVIRVILRVFIGVSIKISPTQNNDKIVDKTWNQYDLRKLEDALDPFRSNITKHALYIILMFHYHGSLV